MNRAGQILKCKRRREEFAVDVSAAGRLTLLQPIGTGRPRLPGVEPGQVGGSRKQTWVESRGAAKAVGSARVVTFGKHRVAQDGQHARIVVPRQQRLLQMLNRIIESPAPQLETAQGKQLLKPSFS